MRARVLCSDYRACMAPWDVNIESRREGDGYLLAARGLCPSDPVAPARALAPVAKAIASLRNVIWLSHPWKAGAHIYFRFSLSLSRSSSFSLPLSFSIETVIRAKAHGWRVFFFFILSHVVQLWARRRSARSARTSACRGFSEGPPPLRATLYLH